MKARILLFLAVIALGLSAQAQFLVNTTWSLYDPEGAYLLDLTFGEDGLLYADVGFPTAISEYVDTGNIVSITDLTDDICTGTGMYAYQIFADTLSFVMVSDPCEDRADIFLNYVWVGAGSTSIAAAGAAHNFEVYPNPSNGQVTVALATAEPVHLRVFDIIGNLVHQVRLTDMNNQLDLGGLGKGSYVIQVVTGQGSISKKLILE